MELSEALFQYYKYSDEWFDDETIKQILKSLEIEERLKKRIEELGKMKPHELTEGDAQTETELQKILRGEK